VFAGLVPSWYPAAAEREPATWKSVQAKFGVRLGEREGEGVTDGVGVMDGGNPGVDEGDGVEDGEGRVHVRDRITVLSATYSQAPESPPVEGRRANPLGEEKVENTRGKVPGEVEPSELPAQVETMVSEGPVPSEM